MWWSCILKHNGFQLGLFATSFACNGIHHYTKSSQVCQLVMMTHAIRTSVQWRSNAINVKKWYFTSLVPNLTSMDLIGTWFGVVLVFGSKWWKGFESHSFYLHPRNKIHHVDEQIPMIRYKFLCKHQLSLLCF